MIHMDPLLHVAFTCGPFFTIDMGHTVHSDLLPTTKSKTFYSLRKRVLKLLFNALETELNATNIQMLLHGALLYPIYRCYYMVLCYTQYTDAITWCFAIPNIQMLLHGALLYPIYRCYYMVLCYTQYTDAITWCFAIPNILMLLHGALLYPIY